MSVRGSAVFLVVGILGNLGGASAADGDIDPGFGIEGVSVIHADAGVARAMRPTAAIELPDGKLLVTGVREKVQPGSPPFEPEIRGMLVRLDADGTPDANFGNSGIPGLAVLPDLAGGRRVQSIDGFARLDDGSLVAVGMAAVNGPIVGYLVKFSAEGVVDSNFGEAGVVSFPLYNFHAVRIDAAGRIVAVGERFDSKSAAYVASVVRLLASGEPDGEFGTEGVFSLTPTDPTESGFLSDVALDADGGIVAGGGFEADGSGLGIHFSAVKLTDAGTLDPTFAGGGWRVFDADAGVSSKIERLLLLPDGSIVFAGFHPIGENRSGPIIGRMTSLGETDLSFGDGQIPGYLAPTALPDSAESADATALLAQPDGKLVVSFGYEAAAEREAFVAVRTSADGRLDADFADTGIFRFDASHGGVFSEIGALAMQSNGRLVAAGRAQATSDILVDFTAVRLLASSADSVFADNFDGVP